MREEDYAQLADFSFWHDVRENEEMEEGIHPQQSDLVGNASFLDMAATLLDTDDEAITATRSTQEEEDNTNHAPAAAAARKMGPSQRHYEQEREGNRNHEQLLMCIVIGLRDSNNRLVDGTNFLHKPYTTYYRWLRANGEKRKEYEPTGSALEKEIDRRFRLFSNNNERRPARARCKDDAIKWLVDHPITDPSDIAFFINEISNYQHFVQTQSTSAHATPSAAANTASESTSTTSITRKTDGSLSSATREEMEHRLKKLELDLVESSLQRKWCREQIVSKAKELEQCGDDEKLRVELELVELIKDSECHVKREFPLRDEYNQIQKKLSVFLWVTNPHWQLACANVMWFVRWATQCCCRARMT